MALRGFNLKEDMVVAGQAGHLVLRVPLNAIANGAAALARIDAILKGGGNGN